MEVIFLVLLPAALWAQAWQLLGVYTNARSLGVIAATVGISLLALTALNTAAGVVSSGPVLSILVGVWAIYALIVAGNSLWGGDERTLGFYSLFLWVVTTAIAAYYFLGGSLLADGGGAEIVSGVMGVAVLLLSLLAALLFFLLAVPNPKMRQATGWVYLVVAIVVTIIGALLGLGLPF